MNETKFVQFYRERFGSGSAVASYFETELANEAALIGVDWSRVSNKISWKSGKAGKYNASGNKDLLKGFKHSVGIYASFEQARSGVEYPLVTFKDKGGAGTTVVFNGYEYLWELFSKEKDTIVSPAQQKAWDDKRRKREEDSLRKRQAAEQRQDAENIKRAKNVEQELNNFSQLPRAASFVYTDKKLIAPILDHIDARSGSDKHGNFIAIKLKHICGKSVGVQRIYDRHITKPDGKKTNKDFTWGMDKSAAHLVIGSLSAERVYVVEGFATGASIFLAMQSIGKECAVIVALDSGNMIKVVQTYQEKAPGIELLLAVDNDMWKQKQGKGNAGMLVAMDLLSEFDEVKAFSPDFSNIDPSYQPTDFNDLHIRAGIKEVAKQLKGNLARVKLEGDLFERSLQRIKYVQFSDAMKEAGKCVQTGMKVGLPKYRPSDVISLIKHTAQSAGMSNDYLNVKQLAEKAGKIFKAKVRDAQKFRSFSPNITRDNLRKDHITYEKFNKSVVDEEVLNYVKTLKGIVIVRFPMGSGKTQGLIKPVIWESDRAAFFAHRVSLIGGAWDALNKDMPVGMAPITHYQDSALKSVLPVSNKLACCINSSIKSDFSPLLNNLSVSCFDEAAQTLRHVTAGSAVKYPLAVFNHILSMMATTRDQVILADADANDTLVEFCELGLKQRNQHLEMLYGENFEPQQIHIIDGVTDCSDTSIYYTDSNAAFHRAVKDVAAGHRVLIANDSAKDGEKLYTKLKEDFPDKKGLFISLDTKESENSEDIEKFTDNPDVESAKYDYLIYSPSISSGVSIENGHFNKHYGIFCGTVAPSDAIQMIRRDRKAREFILGLSTMHSNREESSMAMWLGLLLASDKQLNIDLNKESGVIELKTDNLNFDRFRLELIAQENKAKNDFANNLLSILYADGYKLENLDTTEIESEMGKAAKEAAREVLKDIDLNRHLSQKTPTDDKRDELINKVNLSRDEKAALNRWNIENMLMMPVDENTIDFHHKGGLNKAKLYELLNMSPERAREFDQKEIAAEVQPSHRSYLVKQRQALRDFFELAGFNWQTGEGTATEETLTAALNHLIQGDNIHLFNNFFKFGGYINPFSRNLKPVNKAKSILEAMGLKLLTKQVGRYNNDSAKRQRYVIDDITWSIMTLIQDSRTKSHVTSFNSDFLDIEMIHSSDSILIETEEKTDHSKAFKTKGSSWINAFKHALENLNIPKEYSPKLMAELNAAGALSSPPEKTGIQSLISGIYQKLRAEKPAFF